MSWQLKPCDPSTPSCNDNMRSEFDKPKSNACICRTFTVFIYSTTKLTTSTVFRQPSVVAFYKMDRKQKNEYQPFRPNGVNEWKNVYIFEDLTMLVYWLLCVQERRVGGRGLLGRDIENKLFFFALLIPKLNFMYLSIPQVA